MKINKIISSIVLFILCLGFLSKANSQIELPEDKVKCTFSVEQNDCEATIIVKIKVVKGWHINATVLPKGSFGIPTKFDLNLSKNFSTAGGVVEPKPIEKYDELVDETLVFHEGSFQFKRKIKINSEKDFQLSGSFVFQTCNDVKCLPEHSVPFNLKVKGCVKNEVSAAVVPVDSISSVDSTSAAVAQSVDTATSKNEKSKTENVKKEPAKKEGESSILMIFFLSFLSGLAALLTPCVFPMIPMTVSFFTKQSKTKAQGIKNAIIYSISIIAIYILLGTVVTAVFGAEVLNEMSTNPTFNIVFFIILVVFALSFLGAFEIRLPSSWVNKADNKADKGGLIGIFFMALALALVSFSCTGPIVGSLLVQAASEGGIAPLVGMFGFSLALALPFGLFAAFPGWMNSLPKSGGWLNSVKVVLGFLELALAFKFLSNADLALQAHYLERELFLAVWIGIFLLLAIYLFGMLRLPHDSPLEKISVGRAMLGLTSLIFVVYMIPGMWGAPLNLISAFPPPIHYSESPKGVGASGNDGSNQSHEAVSGTHPGPQNIDVFHDYDKALAHAKKVGKPLFVDFTGHNCVNCRKMEMTVWGQPGIIDILKNDVVIVSLHVDERLPLPASEQKEVEYLPGKKKMLMTTGDKWTVKEIMGYQKTTQPLYVMQTPEGKDIGIGTADYENHRDPEAFKKWLNDGMKIFKETN
jgi:thiol:disulfide interchange protein